MAQDVTISLGMDSSNFNQNLNNAKKQINDLNNALSQSTSKLQTQFSQIGTNISGLTGNVNTLKNAFVGLIGVISVRELSNFSDNITNVKNRLATLGITGADAERQFYALGEMAKKARIPLSDMANLYITFSANAKAMNMSQQEAADMALTVGTAFAKSGVGAAQAQGAILQLSQIFSKGKADGEDFKNVMENIGPVLSEKMAKSIGKSKAELTAMATEGKLTASVIKQMVQNIASDVEKMPAKMTLGQSMTNLQTSFSQAFNNIGGSKFGEDLAKNINAAAIAIVNMSKDIDNLKTTLSPLITLFEILASFWIGGKIVQGLKLFVVAGDGLIAFMSSFWTSLQAVGASLWTFGKYLWQLVTNFGAFWTNISQSSSILKGFGIVFDALISPITKAEAAFKIFFQTLIKGGSVVAAYLGLESLANKFNEIAAETNNATDSINKSTEAFSKQKDEITGASEEYKATFKKTIDDLNDINDKKNRSLSLDTQMVGLGQDQAQAVKELNALNEDRLAQIKKINDSFDVKKQNPTMADFGSKQDYYNYKYAVDEINKSFDTQKESLNGLIATYQTKRQNDRFDQYSTEQRISVQQKLAEIQNETAKIGLPLIAQKYKDIEAAATAAAKAQMEAEAKARGVKPSELPQDVQDKIVKKAWEMVDAIKEDTKAQEDKNTATLKNVWANQQMLDLAKQTRTIQDEIAYSTMPAYQQISAKILADARERARTEIESENVRRGSKMSKEEELQYEQKALAGTQELIKAQQDSYNISRQWNTGWTKALNDYIENATNAAKVAENIFTKAMQGMEDMFVSFVKDGKANWKDFVNSMLEELLRAQFRSTFAKIFGGMTGNNTGQGTSILGGLFSSISSGFSGMFANGGTIGAGQWGIVGEAGPEIVTGPASITPTKNMSSGITNVNYNINAVDAYSFKQMIARDPSFIHAVAMQGAKSIPGVRR